MSPRWTFWHSFTSLFCYCDPQNHMAQHWRLLRLKSVVFKKSKAAAIIQGPQVGLVLTLGALANLLCAEGNFSSARIPKAPLKGRPRYPPSLFPTMQWKQTLSSASNKSQPVVARWAADQARPQVRDLRRKKKKEAIASCFLSCKSEADALVSGTREGKW